MTALLLGETGHVKEERPVRDVVILGSTGSIGTQALDVIAAHRDEFRVVGLAAGGDRVSDLAQQALAFGASVVGVARATAAPALQRALNEAAAAGGYETAGGRLPTVIAGPDAAERIAAWRCDVVLNAMTGSIGLRPTLAALNAGRVLALANKESLIVGGPLVKAAARPGQLVPVDSEHSALAQCLRGGSRDEVRRLVLTASGGPFRSASPADLAGVTVAQALAHPTWDMGPVVTINSATLVNKGLEVIEAHLLFDIPYDAIDVVVHPQSIVHSMVEFTDGSTLAQASPPDMRLPISLALGWPHRSTAVAPACDWSTAQSWQFLPLDNEAFPAVDLARRAGRAGGTAPAVFNAANEQAVKAFLDGNCSFPAIIQTVRAVLDEHLAAMPDAPLGVTAGPAENELSLADVLSSEARARDRADELLEGAA